MMLSTREAYGAALAHWGGEYDFFVLDADLSKATQTIRFAEKYPDRFVNMGIAEANMLSFAAGLSTCGVPVFASTFAVFAAGRGYDMIRNSIAYAGCNVKIGATHGGVRIGADGGSHQCIEDIALMRAVPGMTVICPCDEAQTIAAVQAALEHEGPVYLRFGRFAVENVYDSMERFVIGKGTALRHGTDVTIAAIGDMVSESLKAADALSALGIEASVLDLASIKPMDEALVLECAKRTGCFVTAEDHTVMGGFGSAVGEVLLKGCPCPVEMVGLLDVFGCSGEPVELAHHFSIDSQAIVAAAQKAVQRKKNA